MNENNNKILLELKKKEGLVEFFLPKYYDIKNSFINNDVLEKDTISKSLPVFYNENMIFNRDITEIIVCIYSKLLGRKLKFLDLMAASGIRSIRLLKETDCVEKIYINDLNPLAVKYIEKNLDFNNISNEKYEIFNEDAIIAPLWLSKKTGSNNEYFDVIDIDPFGSPAKYLPSAIQAIKLNGLLCVTATDTPVLFGIKKIQCLRKYLTLPIKTDFLKEVGIRILIYYVMKICNIFELYVEPILSISSDHYIRIFLIVKKGLSGCNNNIKNFGYYIFCPNCLFRDIKKFYENENETIVYGNFSNQCTILYSKNDEFFVEILKPSKGKIYLAGREIARINSERAIIIGKIYVEVITNGKKVEFYLNDKIEFVDYSSPFEWLLNKNCFGNYEIKVISYLKGRIKEDSLSAFILQISF